MNIVHLKNFTLCTVIILAATLLSSGCATVDTMIAKGEYIKAESLCRSLDGDKQKECYSKLAEHYLVKKDYIRAGQYFNKGGFLKTEYNIRIAEACIADGSPERAEDFYRLSGLPENEIFLKLAEATMASGKYVASSGYYFKSGDIDAGIDALRRAIESGDRKMKKEAVSAISKSDNEKAHELLKGLLEDSDPEIRTAARFTLQRKNGGPLKVAYLNIGSTGRRALDGLVSSVYIIKETMVLEKKAGKNKYTIDSQLKRVLGKKGYTLKNISVKSIKRRSRSIIKPLAIDTKKVKKIMQSGDYDIIISKHSHWYEYTKYVKNRRYTPPLKMKISYDFLVYIPALNKKKEFKFSVLHIESSKKTDKKKKHASHARTGKRIYNSKINALKDLESFLAGALE